MKLNAKLSPLLPLALCLDDQRLLLPLAQALGKSLGLDLKDLGLEEAKEQRDLLELDLGASEFGLLRLDLQGLLRKGDALSHRLSSSRDAVLPR